MVTLGVDIGGSDMDQSLLLDALIKIIPEIDAKVVVYSTLMQNRHVEGLIHTFCTDVIQMDDHASFAVRRKKNSTLSRGLQDLSHACIDGLVTCAHTGALTIGASIYVKRFPGVRHPALLVEMPLLQGGVVLIDAGAVVAPSCQDLLTNAFMGFSYAKTVLGIKEPRVGLLNIGREFHKGTQELIDAHAELQHISFPWKYVGNVEPIDVLSGAVDVCVANGMHGNIFLKTAEAAASVSKSPFLSYQPKAAVLAGVLSPVLKCHGEGSCIAIRNALYQAKSLIQENFLSELSASMSFSRKIANAAPSL